MTSQAQVSPVREQCTGVSRYQRLPSFRAVYALPSFSRTSKSAGEIQCGKGGHVIQQHNTYRTCGYVSLAAWLVNAAVHQVLNEHLWIVGTLTNPRPRQKNSAFSVVEISRQWLPAILKAGFGHVTCNNLGIMFKVVAWQLFSVVPHVFQF